MNTSRTQLKAYNVRLKQELYQMRHDIEDAKRELDQLADEITKHRRDFEYAKEYSKTIWYKMWFFVKFRIFGSAK